MVEIFGFELTSFTPRTEETQGRARSTGGDEAEELQPSSMFGTGLLFSCRSTMRRVPVHLQRVGVCGKLDPAVDRDPKPSWALVRTGWSSW